jgi:hypothetical protein
MSLNTEPDASRRRQVGEGAASSVRATGLLRRALQRSPRELATRLAQHAHIVRERVTLALPSARSDERAIRLRAWDGPKAALVEHFRTRPRPRFFAGLDDRNEAVAMLRSRWPEDADAAIAAADRVLAGEFDLLGYRGLRFGSPPDWHLDPLRQVRAPAEQHWSRIAYLDPEIAGDHKVVWELNRHQYLVRIGQAYWLTGDVRYADAFVHHVNAWMKANPPHTGVNWASSLEVSFRAISWVWALHFFRDAPGITAPFLARMLETLRLHGQHLQRYLSTYFSPNTHLTGEALGLFYLGTVFPEFRQAARWRGTGLEVLAREIPRQVLPDGVYFEQSTWYHRYTADFLVHLIVLARSNDIAVSAAHAETLERMLMHVVALTCADGTVPLIGDDDGGALMPLAGPPTADFTPLLSTGAALFGRGDLKYLAGACSAETFWLLGADGVRQFDELEATPPAFSSAAFGDGGFYVMRDGWNENASCLIVDAGPHGALTGGHAHADALAIVVASGGAPVLVDSGTGTYTTDPDLRDRHRASRAHNTLSVDGRSSAVPGGPFGWETTVDTVVDCWLSRERFDFFSASHDGFARPGDEVVHRREILYLRGDYWVLRDTLRARRPLSTESRFHFGPRIGCETLRTGVGAAGVLARVDGDEPSFRIHVVGAPGVRLEGTSVSDVYGSFHPASCAVFPVTMSEDDELLTFIMPGIAAATAAHQLQAGRGTAVTLSRGDVVDYIITGAAEAPGISTDFEWAWVRRCTETGRVLDYVLLSGSFLALDGETIMAGTREQYVCMNDGGVVADSLAED